MESENTCGSTSTSLFIPRIDNGQGKTAMTILTEEGCHYPVIHDPYSHRHSYSNGTPASAPARIRRGDRPMHKTTLTLAKPPWGGEYMTTSKQYYSGSPNLEPVRRPPKCRSMHGSQIRFGAKEDAPDHFMSDHQVTYHKKDIIPYNRLHLTSLVHRIEQTEGAKVKEVVRPGDPRVTTWTQYNRVHNKLGALRGPGVAREYPVRQQYDVITGEEKGDAWSPTNNRVSGNRVLHSMRRQFSHKPLLF